MKKDSKIFVAGHRGLVGSAIVDELKERGYTNLLLKTHLECDLADATECENLFKAERPEFIFLAAAKVGGIAANNTYRADFIAENLAIQSNVITNAHKYGAKKLLFLGSSCIYPKNAPQPMKESALLTSELEYTNEPYAIAKIAGLKMCEAYALQYGCNFVSVMPTNLYGDNDNFDLETSHVLPALIAKFHAAKVRGEKSVTIWGSGTPRREFLHAKDMAKACVFVMERVDFADLAADSASRKGEVRNTHINIGYGSDISIAELAELIAKVVGFKGAIVKDTAKPDGTMQKLLDCSKLTALGWHPTIDLESGIKSVYEHYVKNVAK